MFGWILPDDDKEIPDLQDYYYGYQEEACFTLSNRNKKSITIFDLKMYAWPEPNPNGTHTTILAFFNTLCGDAVLFRKNQQKYVQVFVPPNTLEFDKVRN